jgi:hypothetical protein
MKITLYDDEGCETEYVIPAVWEICSTCNGDGAHSRHLGAITSDDLDRDWSPDEFEDYLAGAYDRTCETCKGTGKFKVPAEPDKEPAKSWIEQEEIDAAERRADMRTLYMESGGSMGQW